MSVAKRIKEIKKDNISKEKYPFIEDEEGRVVVDIGVKKYEELFSSFNLRGNNVLNLSFVTFLQTKAEAIPLDRKITLKFHVKDPTEEKKEQIESAVRENYERGVKMLNGKMHNNTMFSLLMLAIGLCFLGVHLVLKCFAQYGWIYVGTIMTEIGTWVFIWEAVNRYFLERKEMRDKKIKAYRLMTAKIIIGE